jgi:hypothetical protein
MATDAPKRGFEVQAPAYGPLYVPRNVPRPGVISAVGAAGIVFGCLSILMSLAGAAGAVGLIATARSNAEKVRRFASAALPVSSPSQPVAMAIVLAPPEVGARGMDSAERARVIVLLRRSLALAPQQESQLDALLQEAGHSVFPDRVPTTDEAVDAALKEHGAMPSDAADGVQPVFFVTAGGRADLYGDRAVFDPADRSAVVRTSAGPRLNSTGHPILRPQDTRDVIALIQQNCHNQLNAAQVGKLTELLASPDQQLIAATGQAAGPIVGINSAMLLQPGGYAMITFAGGTLLLSPAGQVILKGDDLPGVSGTACGAVIVESLASITMAVWLLVICKRLLAQSIVTPRQHRTWAMAKMSEALLGAGAVGWLIWSMIATMPPGAAGPLAGQAGGVASTGAFVVCIAAFTYPVAAMILLARASAKLYFDGVR